MSKEEKHTLFLLTVGIFLFFVVASIPVLIFSKDRLKSELSLFAGAVMAVGLALHMNFSIVRAIHMERRQSAYLALSSVGRLLVVAGLIVLAAWTGVMDPLFIVVGMLGLKIGAYIQPALEKRFKIKNKQ